MTTIVRKTTRKALVTAILIGLMATTATVHAQSGWVSEIPSGTNFKAQNNPPQSGLGGLTTGYLLNTHDTAIATATFSLKASGAIEHYLFKVADGTTNNPERARLFGHVNSTSGGNLVVVPTNTDANGKPLAIRISNDGSMSTLGDKHLIMEQRYWCGIGSNSREEVLRRIGNDRYNSDSAMSCSGESNKVSSLSYFAFPSSSNNNLKPGQYRMTYVAALYND